MGDSARLPRVHVCHVAMGDLWAGAEVQLAALVAELVARPELELSVVLFNEGRLASEIRRLGVQVTVFPESELSGMAILTRLVAHCRAHRFDLVHTHKYKDNLFGVIASKMCGIPHVVRTIHGLSEPFQGWQALRMGLYSALDNMAIRLGVEKVIAVSEQIQETLARQFGRERVVPIHNGVRLEGVVAIRSPSEVREQLGMPSEWPLIGTVGRLTPVKGFQHFLAAAKLLLQERGALGFVVVGDGPLMESLRSEAESLGIARHVYFVGHRDDTYDFMRAMDVFVLPSLHEGIPMVLLEAMALARPVVASRVGGIPEVVQEPSQGVLVPAEDPAAIAAACRKLLDHRLVADQHGQMARQRVEREFSSTLMAQRVWALYQSLTAHKRNV